MRVVSYNVLSSSLCSPAHFTTVFPEHCASQYRFHRVCGRLELEMRQQHPVVCLQEVSLEWAGKLHAFFERNGYTFIVSNYGNKSNGYMGVGVAYPRVKYELKGVDVTCVADTKPGGWWAPRPKEPLPPAWPGLFRGWLVRKLGLLAQLVTGTATTMRQIAWSSPAVDFRGEKRESPWAYAASRQNRVVSLHLHPIGVPLSGQDFVVSTYHMPCAFWAPSVMTIHAWLLMQHVQGLFGGKMAYVVAGDFNIKPSSPLYELFTKGTLPATVDDPTDPVVHGLATMPSEPCFAGDSWSPFYWKRGSVQSAYATVAGHEPPFTNFAMTKDMTQTFAHTLDYIFYGQGDGAKLRCVAVADTDYECATVLCSGNKSLPSKTEGSDHLLVAATFVLE